MIPRHKVQQRGTNRMVTTYYFAKEGGFTMAQLVQITGFSCGTLKYRLDNYDTWTDVITKVLRGKPNSVNMQGHSKHKNNKWGKWNPAFYRREESLKAFEEEKRRQEHDRS